MPSPFRYIDDPQHYQQNDALSDCVGCGRNTTGFGFFVFLGDGVDDYNVCETCLVTGRLKDLSLPVNDADTDTLEANIAGLMPDLTVAESTALAAQRTEEVTYRTPHPGIANLFVWPAHCCDYMVFHGQVTVEDINGLAQDGKRFFAEHLEQTSVGYDGSFIDQSWQGGLLGHNEFYLWRCSSCLEYLITYVSE